jgi:hypothetical protein
MQLQAKSTPVKRAQENDDETEFIAWAQACPLSNRKIRARFSDRASRLRRTSRAMDMAGIWNRKGRREEYA